MRLASMVREPVSACWGVAYVAHDLSLHPQSQRFCARAEGEAHSRPSAQPCAQFLSSFQELRIAAPPISHAMRSGHAIY